MVCDILDVRCIFMNELIGSPTLAVLILVLLMFVVASRIKFGFDTTLVLAIPTILLIGFGISGFAAIMALTTIIVGLMLAWLFNQIIGN